jgi:apolipoprotein N-acyltransferase
VTPPIRTRADDGAASAVLYPPAARIAAALLRTVARGGLLWVLGLMLFTDNPPTNPLKQIRLFTWIFLVPEAAAWALARVFEARMRIEDGALVLEQRARRTDIPVSAISSVKLWHFPVPSAGVWLGLRSGRRFAQGLAVADPDSLVRALEAEGASPEIREGLEGGVGAWHRARVANPPTFFENPFLKFVVYGLVPTIPAWRLYQFISYGGTFGEYYTYGLNAYLVGFGLWWASFALHLVFIAAGIRAFVELVCLAAAFGLPSHAAAVRRFLEITQRVAYYAGIPLWLLIRFEVI